MPGEQFKFEGVRSDRVLIPGEFLSQKIPDSGPPGRNSGPQVRTKNRPAGGSGKRKPTAARPGKKTANTEFQAGEEVPNPYRISTGNVERHLT